MDNKNTAIADTIAQAFAVNYLMLFSPDTYSNGYEFESEFAKFLEVMGKQARVVRGMDGVIGGQRIIMISNAPKAPEPPPPPPQKGSAPKVQLKALTNDYKKNG